MSFNKNLVDNLKREFKVKQDQDLAEMFNVTPFVFSSWKRSKGKLIEETVKYGVANKLDFNAVFHGNAIVGEKDVSVLMAEDLFSYYLNPKETISILAKYSIPSLDKSSLGFQVISQNMEPTLEVSSLVFGVEVGLNELKKGCICVVSVKNRGIFITRFEENQGGKYIFKNDNKQFPDFSFTKEDVISVFKASSFLGKL